MRLEPFSLPNLKSVVDLGRLMHNESRYNPVPFDAEKAAISINEHVLKNPDGFGRLALDARDKPVGIIAGIILPYFFSKESQAVDFVWYVVPEARGSSTAIRMLNAFQGWAKERGAMEINMGVTTGVQAERTGKLLERMGYTNTGGNFRKTL